MIYHLILQIQDLMKNLLLLKLFVMEKWVLYIYALELKTKKYVVKVSKFFSRKLDYDNMNNFVNDINRHKEEPGSFFIQKYIDFWIEDIYEKYNKSTANNKNMYIVTDYCINGNLKDYISNIKKNNNVQLNYSFYWDIIFQMIIPINFLHKLGYIHFDIKPTNYLVMNNNQLLLNDFVCQ